MMNTPVSNNASSIRKAISEKVGSGQTHRVIVDVTNTTQTEAAVRAALRAHPVPGLKEVMVLGKTGLGKPFRP